MQTHNSLSQQCLSAVSFTGVPSCYTNWINSSYSFPITTIRAVSQSIFFPRCVYTVGYKFAHMYPIPLKLREKKYDRCRKKKKTTQNVRLRTWCMCQIYGITLYGAARADESSTYPVGLQIHLSTQTFCFLPRMCCALKQTCQKVYNVKSVFAQVC